MVGDMLIIWIRCWYFHVSSDSLDECKKSGGKKKKGILWPYVPQKTWWGQGANMYPVVIHQFFCIIVLWLTNQFQLRLEGYPKPRIAFERWGVAESAMKSSRAFSESMVAPPDFELLLPNRGLERKKLPRMAILMYLVKPHNLY